MIYRTLICLLLAVAVAWGQQEWVAVRGLAAEAKVEVHAKGYPQARGRVVSVTEDRLTIRTGKGEQAYRPCRDPAREGAKHRQARGMGRHRSSGRISRGWPGVRVMRERRE